MNYIPEKITIVYRTGDGSNGYEAFPVPSGKKHLLETARNWGQKRKYSNEVLTCKEIELDNIPVKVQIKDLDVRGEGGRAWRVKYLNYIVDLREPELLETINNIQDGFIQTPMVFARIENQTKLIPYLGKKYNEIVTLNNNLTTNLEIGALYKNSKNDYYFYLGKLFNKGKEEYALVWSPNKGKDFWQHVEFRKTKPKNLSFVRRTGYTTQEILKEIIVSLEEKIKKADKYSKDYLEERLKNIKEILESPFA